MTYHTPDVDSGPSDEAGKRAGEIEVTPEMIEAGAEALARLDGEGSEIVAEIVFKAMIDRKAP